MFRRCSAGTLAIVAFTVAVTAALPLRAESPLSGPAASPATRRGLQGAYFPDVDKVRRFISGRRVLVGLVGDSLSFPLTGSDPAVGASHVNLGIGFIRRFRFCDGQRGLFMPPGTQSLYSGVAGVWYGSNSTDRFIEFSDALGARDGSDGRATPDDLLETQLGRRILFFKPPQDAIYGNFILQNPAGLPGASIPITSSGTGVSAALLAAPARRFHMFVVESWLGTVPVVFGADAVDQDGSVVKPIILPAPGVAAPGDWRLVDFDLRDLAAPFDPAHSSLRLRFRTFFPGVGGSNGDAFVTMGGYFLDTESNGALIVPLSANGGWHTGHHRTDTPGPNGLGYTPAAMGRRLLALGFDDPAAFRVLVVALGQNINSDGEVGAGGVTSEQFKVNIAAIVDQWAAAGAARGCAFDQVLLLGTPQWGPPGDQAEYIRAASRCDRLYELAQERGWWYAGAPYLVDPWLPEYYFIPGADHHLSLAGSEAVADGVWNAMIAAAGPWPCQGDATGDGAVGFADIVEVLSRWGEPAEYGHARGDTDGDAQVGFADIVATLSNWGVTCE